MNQRIQVLSGLAIVMVLLQHGLVLEWLIPKGWYTPGWSGVHLFFVISGCVIAESLLRDDCHFGRFIVRRIIRLWPALVCFLGLIWILNQVLAHEIGYPLGVITENRYWIYSGATMFGLVYPLMYFGIQMPAPFMFEHVWSLSVEDIFYVGFGLVAGRVLLRRSTTYSAIAMAVLAVGICAMRAVSWSGAINLSDTAREFLGGHASDLLPSLIVAPVMIPVGADFDFLLAGIIVAMLSRTYLVERWAAPAFAPLLVFAALSTALLTLAGTGNPVTGDTAALALYGMPTTLLSFSLAVFLCWKDKRPLTSNCARFLRHIGDLSYSLYLVHLPIGAAVSSLLYRFDLGWQQLRPGSFAFAFFLIYGPLSYLLALALHRGIELPILVRGKAWVRASHARPERRPA